MTDTFYWYDLETTGVDPKWDRIVQFAGFRTDTELQQVGEAHSFYIRLPDDVLPNPDATLVTGITPDLLAREGRSEAQALKEINDIFSEPGTCVVGYNNLRFDDEFMRYGLYRNLFDPYSREWRDGNSRWDLIDLVRATGALRREGITWPQDENGLPVYKLEALTQANGLEHGQAHDASSDVHATVAMARLIKQAQPKLFSYYYEIRQKKKVRALLEPYGARLLVHVTGMYPRERYGMAPILSLGRHPSNANSIIVADLAQDIEPLLNGHEDALREALFTKGDHPRPGLKEIKVNRCPFVAPIDVLDVEHFETLGVTLREVKERARRLKQPYVAQKIRRLYTQEQQKPPADPDAALYAAFLQDEDRARCRQLRRDLETNCWQDMDFNDTRLHTLAARLKARSYDPLMSEAERAEWREFVIHKLTAEGEWLNLEKYLNRLDELDQGSPTAEHQALITHLRDHASYLKHSYSLT